MRNAWQRWSVMLTPGVRGLLGVLFLAYLAAIMGELFRIFDLGDWIAFNGPKFWSGQVWRGATFVLLPAGILDFLMNDIALVLLGGLLERHWSRGEFWWYCLVSTVGAGVALALLHFLCPVRFSGSAPLVFGLMMAWGFLCGHEVISIVALGEITVWKLVLGAAVISLFVTAFTAGWVRTLAVAAGGATGFFYLWLKHKWLMSRASCIAHSDRISRLEL